MRDDRNCDLKGEKEFLKLLDFQVLYVRGSFEQKEKIWWKKKSLLFGKRGGIFSPRAPIRRAVRSFGANNITVFERGGDIRVRRCRRLLPLRRQPWLRAGRWQHVKERKDWCFLFVILARQPSSSSYHVGS